MTPHFDFPERARGVDVGVSECVLSFKSVFVCVFQGIILEMRWKRDRNER